MRYWDSSALLPLLVEESLTGRSEKALHEDSRIITWWGTRVECASALNRLYRQQSLDDAGIQRALGDLEILSSGWIEVQPTEKLRLKALRLLRVHPLRAADALHLAAALLAFNDSPQHSHFMSFDERLSSAAVKEGFTIQQA